MLRKFFLFTMIAMSIPVLAQFGAPKVGTSDGGSQPVDTSALVKNQKTLVDHYVGAVTDVFNAQIPIADALGLKDVADKIKAEKDSLGKGNCDGNAVSRSSKLSQDSMKIIEEKAKSVKEFDDAAKKKVEPALPLLASACVKTGLMVPDAISMGKDTADAIKKASAQDALKIKSDLEVGLVISKNLPGFVKDLTNSTGNVIKIFGSKGVDVSKAQKALPKD